MRRNRLRPEEEKRRGLEKREEGQEEGQERELTEGGRFESSAYLSFGQ